MADRKTSSPMNGEPGIEYEIKIKGYLEEHWSDWLGGLEIRSDEHGNSFLRGAVSDQAGLHGILNQIRDLGLTLIELKPQNPEDHAEGEKDEKSGR